MLIEKFDSVCLQTVHHIVFLLIATTKMPPKIEDLGAPRRPKNNPFEEKPKKTIRRTAEETKKGLNEPQFKGNTKLDHLFIKLETIVDGPLESLDIDTLSKRLDIVSQGFEERYKVIEHLLSYLQQVQTYSEEVQHEDKLLIKISLHDIKTFSKLVNIIVIQGVYSALSPFKIGIPIEKRQLRLFHTSKKPLKIAPVKPQPGDSYTESFTQNEKLLVLIYEGFSKLFLVDLDVKDLLLKGTGYSDFLTISAALSTIPYFGTSTRQKFSKQHIHVASIPETYELMQTYSLLAASPSPSYFKQFIMSQLQLLHYNAPRKDGLLALIELVCGLRDKENISTEAFDHVARVVLSKPKSVPTGAYFDSIGEQAYNLLVNINRPIVANCICHFMELLWHKNQLVLNDFFLKKFWSCFNPTNDVHSEVIVSETLLNNNINVLLSLTKNGLPKDFMMAVFSPILIQLWSYFKFLRRNLQPEAVIKAILRGFLLLSDSTSNFLTDIAKNLTVDGGEFWAFAMGPNQLPQIERKLNGLDESSVSSDKRINSFLGELDESCAAFVELCEDLDESLIQSMFLSILKRWLKTDTSQRIDGDEDPFFVLVDLRLLESIGNKFKEKLARTPFGMLELVYNILLAETTPEQTKSSLLNETVNEGDSDDEDEEVETQLSTHTINVALELTSAIISESTLSLDKQCIDLLRLLVLVLKKVQKNVRDDQLKLTIGSFSERINTVLEGDKPISSAKEAQKQTLKKAIISLNDPLVPVRAHGLYLLRSLVEEKSEVITLEFVLNLHLNQLKDSDPFVYLNAIKGLESLIHWDEKDVVNILTRVYAYPDQDNLEGSDLDERLKVGEVLLRYIQGKGSAFSGSLAETVADATLHLIRRSDEKSVDSRLRMSAMSLLGVCCKTNPLGILNRIENALDCAIGILQLETDVDSSVMRRAAVVLINDLVEGTSLTDKVPFPPEYKSKVWEILNYISSTDKDILTREQASIVLDYIKELLDISLAKK